MHVELAVNAMELAADVDAMILFSGDGDFRSLVEAIRFFRTRDREIAQTLPAALGDYWVGHF
jgi:uncharacterized LabA/DUF88 family protein